MNGYSRFPVDTHDRCPHCERYALHKDVDRTEIEQDGEFRMCYACFGIVDDK